MVSIKRGGRNSSAKRRYTKRKFYRNKHARKSYHMKRRGGGKGFLIDCEKECNKHTDPNKRQRCKEACVKYMTDAAPVGHPLYQEKLTPEIEFEYPDVNKR